MRTITEETIVNATPERVWDFLVNLHLGDNYKRWHPKDHVSFKLLKGNNMGDVGSEAHFKEYIGGFPLFLSYKTVAAKYPEYLGYTAIPPLSWLHLGKGTLRMEKLPDGTTRLTAHFEYGWSVPVIGKLLDWLIEHIVKNSAGKKHMHEEGENIKKIVEQ